MTPSALEWFADLCCVYAHAPVEARSLGRDLHKQFSSKDARKQVNRVFKRHEHSIVAISDWLGGKEFSAAVAEQSSALIKVVHETAVEAIKKIIAGETPSVAWNMGAQRGRDIGFSATMEAVALARYLSKIWLRDRLPTEIFSPIEDLEDDPLLNAHSFNQRKCGSTYLFNLTKAVDISAVLFNVHPESIRKYSGPDAGNAQSEACMALFGLRARDLLQKAERYFDIDELIIASIGAEF